MTRLFESGATRDSDQSKLAWSRFLSPFVLHEYAKYMHSKRSSNVPPGQALRDPDNWQKGIPIDAYAESLTRHGFEFWMMHESGEADFKKMIETLCAILFNAMGYMLELLKGARPTKKEGRP